MNFIKSNCQHAQNAFFGFIRRLVFNFATLTVKNHYGVSIIGFVVVFVFVLQLISGISLALSLIPDTMLVPSARDEEDADALFTDDLF
jgi:hypothetical protein